jgi:hypothetical protein
LPFVEGELPQPAVSHRFFVVCLVGVCVLSAAVGSGIALLAKTGPVSVEELESKTSELCLGLEVVC